MPVQITLYLVERCSCRFPEFSQLFARPSKSRKELFLFFTITELKSTPLLWKRSTFANNIKYLLTYCVALQSIQGLGLSPSELRNQVNLVALISHRCREGHVISMSPHLVTSSRELRH